MSRPRFVLGVVAVLGCCACAITAVRGRWDKELARALPAQSNPGAPASGAPGAPERADRPAILGAAVAPDESLPPVPPLELLKHLRDDVCACTNRACLVAVNQRYGALVGRVGRQGALDAKDSQAYLELSRSTRPCIQRILDAEP